MAGVESAEPTCEVVFSPGPRDIVRRPVAWHPGLTVAEALVVSGLAEVLPNAGRGATGVWGRLAGPDTVLQPGDRVEVYRPLTVDPKEARRQRYKAQGPRRKPPQPRRPRPASPTAGAVPEPAGDPVDRVRARSRP